MKALILAAGFGSRLRPLTDKYPKPLCPYMGIALIDLAYWRLRQAGIVMVACNSHHLAKSLAEHLQSSRLYQDAPPKISWEREIRGTGGCLYPLRDWLGKDDYLVIYNGDILSDIDLSLALAEHQRNNADATMILLDKSRKASQPVYIDPEGAVCGFASKNYPASSSHQSHIFTGIHILSAAFVRSIPSNVPWSILDSYQARIEAGFPIRGYICGPSTFWHDLGSPEAFWFAHQSSLDEDTGSLFTRLGVHELRSLYELGKLKLIDKSKSLICDSLADVIDPSQLSQSFVLSEKCLVKGDVTLQQCIVLPDVTSLKQSARRCLISGELHVAF